MPYLFATQDQDYADFASGRVIYNAPGMPAFPVRLASEMFQRARALLEDLEDMEQLARLLDQEIKADQARRKPRLASFAAVAGVPMGGLHLATAYALVSDTPLIYVRPDGDKPTIEGQVIPGQTVLIIDDLMTGGTSILTTAWTLGKAGMTVRDAIVLVDREQGGIERLHQHGYRVLPILRLKTMLMYYRESGLISEEEFQKASDYLERTRPYRPS